jgi:hypothetical protein
MLRQEMNLPDVVGEKVCSLQFLSLTNPEEIEVNSGKSSL